METTHFDLVIIGGGPAGYGAALYGASAGLNIALVEKDKVGGTCLHRGCIPAKELLETAAVVRTIAHAEDFGIKVEPIGLEWSTTLARKQAVVDKLAGGVTGLLKNRKVTILDGTATLGAGRTVTVVGGDESVTLTGDAVILAPGSVPRVIPGFEPGGPVVTSDEFFHIPGVPERAVVIGGGAIGCEFASTLADLGASVTILEALPKILPGCDEDVTRVVLQSFKKKGIDVRTGVAVSGHAPSSSGATTVSFGDGESIETDLVVVSVGRSPFTDGVIAEGTGVRVTDRGHIEVDGNYRTGEPSVWAIGDVIATPQLAHVGFAEAICVVKDILGEEAVPVDNSKVPWAIYCQPEVAFAGMSEAAAKEAGIEVVTSKHRFGGNSRAMIIGQTDGLVKIIAEKRPDGSAGKLLGVHMVGPWVTEQLSGGYLAVNWEATADEVAAFIQPHPSLTELFGESVLALTGRSLHG
ncbi:MAG TPA: dihydrolipoyl dehydrogenase [Microthrixaceae bacterium]|nr:dihydrolipoyl dehydrogenase [Microthrixaceae bacterium]HMX05936.1 dihydrolipoyl dehydrogenase [Microthrixaceae bacterium]HMX64705.1 dihydrolipoyl dehydrogenase [Microthrixaceae bacterium]HMY86617.1 dihydrolipoyl dehydrogenase [Microthrixaceae bacterium]HNA35435.1 dihydrolipoyl dehydrogenase [Microthrixaceae bacterium]